MLVSFDSNKRDSKAEDERAKNLLEFMRNEEVNTTEVFKQRDQNVREIAANLEHQKEYQEFVKRLDDERENGSMSRKRYAPSFKTVFRANDDDEDDE